MQRTKFNDDDDQSCILNFRIRSCATACSWTERENGESRGIHANFQGMPFDLNFARVISREWTGNYTEVGNIDSIGFSNEHTSWRRIRSRGILGQQVAPTTNVSGDKSSLVHLRNFPIIDA